MSAPGRAGRGMPVRAGRGVRAGPSSPVDAPGRVVGESGDEDRTTPSPETTKFMARVAQKSPVTSPTEGQSPQDSPQGSPSAQMAGLRVTDKYAEPEPISKSYGKEGTDVLVSVNFVRVILSETSGPYIYHVRFAPDVDAIDVRRRIMRSDPVAQVIGTVQAFTGMNMYLPVILDDEKVVVNVPHPNDPSVSVKVTIEYLKKPEPEELIPFYNTLLRRAMRELRLVQIKHHYYMPQEKIAIPHLKLEVWPGQVCKITELESGLLLICEASHRVLRTSTALDMLRDIHRQDKNNFKDNAKRQIVGSVILTRYNNKPYRVDDIDFNQNPTHKFMKSDGSEISYVDYFKTAWKQNITDFGQPLLIHSPKPRKGETETRSVTLIPELSCMTGLTDDIRSDTRAMRDIATHTRIPPEVRYQKLIKFLESLERNQAAKAIFEEWNVRLDTKPMDVNARYLTQETLLFGNNRKVSVPENVSWSREATGTALYQCSDIKDWVVIYNKRDEQMAGQLVGLLKDVTKYMGFSFEMPRRQPLAEDNPTAYVNAVRAVATPATQIVMILTPGSSMREDRYNAIKKICCCDLAVPSQVVRIATVSDQKKARSVAQKVALQMQCKVGGAPWIVNIPFKTAMFVGIDVYHDPNRQAKSCVAVVASVNAACSKWFSKVAFQSTSEEITHTLQAALLSAMNKFKENTGKGPDRIILYRDGVGDGQVPVVASYEVPQLTTAVSGFEPGLTPKVSCVIVQKRVDTRMLLRAGPTSLVNPKAGTVLDREVTRKNYADFYLVSQHVTQGTVTPTHYIVVADQIGLDADKMQRLTYRMTHMYYNWPGNVRVPAPCQYAHKIAYLIGQNVKAIPKESISDKLFFL